MWRAAVVLTSLVVALAPQAGAQERTCDLVESGRIDRDEMSGITTFHDPFYFRCSDGTELRADQGSLNQWVRELTLNGNVFFRDPDRTLTSDHATYNSGIGRLFATGNVVFTNRAEGSTIRGPELEYFRPMPERPSAQVTARQRPHLVLRPKAAGSEAEPLELDADEVMIHGQDQLLATGQVVITRSDLRATAGQARYSEAAGDLELRNDARIHSEQYSLTGQVVRARLPQGVLEHLRSDRDAELKGDDLTVTATEVQLFFADSVLQRAVARSEGGEGAERAVAVSGTFRMEADSLDAMLPGQQLQQVVAVGRALGEAVDTAAAAVPGDGVTASDSAGAAPDSAALAAARMIDRDWIRGDTVIGFFAARDSAAARGAASDTAVVLQRLLATGNAQSLYRVEQQNVPAGSRRGVNFLSGDVIELSFDQGQLQLAEVTGLRKGLYLDPMPAAPKPQSPGGEPTTPTEPAEPGPTATPQQARRGGR